MKTANGDYRKEHRERSRSPIERAAAPTVSLHANHMYASIPNMDQPLALTKNSMDATRSVSIASTMTAMERQQVLGFLIVKAHTGWLQCVYSYHFPLCVCA